MCSTAACPMSPPALLTQSDSVLKGTMGIFPLIVNTLCVIVLSLLIALPLGVGAAIYLTEYATNQKTVRIIEYTTETLAGIPRSSMAWWVCWCLYA